MKLTRAGEYAIRAVLFLAGQPEGRVVNRKRIAEAMDIPYPFLGKIGPALAGADIIRITQGPRGGYQLSRPPGQITLLDVIVAIEGDIPLNECVVHPEACRRSPACSVHQVWQQARQALCDVLDGADFATLSQRMCHDC